MLVWSICDKVYSMLECDTVIYMQQCVQYVSVIEWSICNMVYSMLECDKGIYM
jgi:hypothetical protein